MQGITKLSMVLIVVGLTICNHVAVWGADWKPFGFSGIYFYDNDSITRTSDNHVKVWMKRLATEKEIIDIVGKFGKDYVDLGYTLSLDEIVCTDKTSRILSIKHYSKDGSIIWSGDNTDEKWSFIAPESVGESLYKEVCK